MIKKDELSNPASCLNKAHDDEPIFTLRANDPLAPIMVRMWAEYYIASKTDARGQCPPENAFKYHEALRSASLMDAWAEEEKRRASRNLPCGCQVGQTPSWVRIKCGCLPAVATA
jgi:hypothetical protein